MKNKSFIYLFSKIFSALLNLVIIYIFTRSFSPSVYGGYLLFCSYVLFVCSFVFWWHRLSVYRYYYKFKNVMKTYLKTSYVSYYILCLIIICLVFILNVKIIKNVLNIHDIVSFSLIAAIFKSNFDLNQNLLNISKNDSSYGINVVLRPLLFLIICLFLHYYYPENDNVLIIGFTLSYFLSTVHSNFLFQSKIFGASFDKLIIKKFYSFGFPLTALYLFDYLLTSSDRIIIGFFLGNKMVGIYGANYDLIRQFILFLMVIQNLIVYPEVNKNYEKKDYNYVKKLMSLNLEIFVAIYAPILVLITLHSDLISNIFIGENFNQSSPFLIPIFALTFFFWGFKIYHFDYIFQLKEKTKLSMKILFFGSFINVLLNVVFIPKYGIIGAAVSTLISYFICLFLSFYNGMQLLIYKIEVHLIFKTIVFLIISSSLSLYLKNLNFHVSLQIILFIFSYSLLFFNYNKRVVTDYLNRFHN